jgi:hypothetical protein
MNGIRHVHTNINTNHRSPKMADDLGINEY